MRRFTVDEANALIPKLEMIMERMQRCALALRRETDALAAELGCPAAASEVSELLAARPQSRPLVEELEGLVREIEACGGEFKGLDLGLVDFPAEIDGTFGLLCWQFGEKEITHWHTVEGGFAGRQPLRAGTRRAYLQ